MRVIWLNAASGGDRRRPLWASGKLKAVGGVRNYLPPP